MKDPHSNAPGARPDLPPPDYATRVDGLTPGAPPERPSGRALPAVEGYEILRELGRGGMGVVYEARQLTLNRKVALKMVLSGEHAADRTVARFLAEAEIAAGLQHSNIVHIHELGEAMGLPYIAMEFVDGSSMSDRVRTFGDDYRAIAGFFEKLARATQWAHQNAVIHRDLKPGNVLISRDGEPKIADFGLAKRFGENIDQQALTRSGEQMGTPAYMAPEQAFPDLGAIGPAADIYSLGVMLYEVLTGKVPISGNSHAEMLTKLRNEDPSSPAWMRPGLPADLETICMKCLRKRPRDRYASAGDLADDLRRFIADEPILAKPPSAVTVTFRWVRRHRLKVAVLITTLVASAVVGGILLHLSARRESERQAQEKREREEYEYLHVRKYTATYRNFTRRHGQYIGSGAPLTAEELAHRSSSYQIVREGREGRCLRMSLVDSTGRPTYYWATPDVLLIPGLLEGVPRHRLPCIFELHYTTDDRVSEERLLDSSSTPVARIRYTYPEGYDPAKPQSGYIQADIVDEFSHPLETPSGLSSVQLVRDRNGQEHQILYADARGVAKEDKYRAGGMELAYNDHGLLTQITTLNKEGVPAANSIGRAVAKYGWNERQVVTSHSFFDLKGQPATVGGVHLTRAEDDQWGNSISARFFGIDGKTPAHNSSSAPGGPTGLFWTYGSDGFPLTLTSEGYDEKLNGFASVTTTHEWAGDGSVHWTIRWLGSGGKPARGGMGWETTEEWVDPAGRVLRTIRSGFDEKTVFHYREEETNEWSPAGDKIRSVVKYLDKDNKPARDISTKAREVTKEFDPAGRVTKSVHMMLNPSPYARLILETEWKKEEDSGARRFPGLASKDTGTDSEAASASSSLTSSISRIQAAIRGRSPEMAKRTGSYFDENGKPVPGPDGNTGWTKEFDDKGFPVKEVHTGFNPAEKRYARVVINTEWKPDHKGYTDKWSYYDSAEKPVRHRNGFLTSTKDVDEKGRTLRETNSGFDESRASYANEVIEYSDYTGNIFRHRAYLYTGKDGQRVRYRGEYLDYAEKFDDKGNPLLVETAGYDPEKYPWFSQTARITASPDGTTTHTKSWRDAQGRPCRGQLGEMESQETFNTAEQRLISKVASGFDEAKYGYVTRTIRLTENRTLDLEFTNSKGQPVKNLRPFIVKVDPGSIGESLKLLPDDLILSYNGTPTSNSIEFAEGKKPGGSMEILRKGKRLKFDKVPAGKLGVLLEDRAFTP
ncbi:MAG TPA: protein kinase [Verrucomicrobiales bacterium]|nr:protein kinase [Verrucomicrobiales bacterium]